MLEATSVALLALITTELQAVENLFIVQCKVSLVCVSSNLTWCTAICHGSFVSWLDAECCHTLIVVIYNALGVILTTIIIVCAHSFQGRTQLQNESLKI